MADITNNVITNFKLKASGKASLDKLTASQAKAAASAKALRMQHMEIRRVMKATGLTANQSARAINQLGFTFNKSGRAVDALGKRMKLTRKTMVDMNKTTRRFNLGFLSLMFASMALNRAVGTFLRSAIGAYAKATGETNNFRKETNMLVATWEFFKFSLIDALSQSELFQRMIQFLVNLINWFNALSPKTKIIISLVIAFTFLASAVGLVLGQIGLAAGGVAVLGDLFGITGLTAAGALKKMAIGLLKLIGFLAIIAASFIFIKSLLFGFDEDLDEWAASWQRNGGVVAKIIGGLIRLFNFAGEFMRVAFMNAIDSIVLVWQGMMNVIIFGLNKIIQIANLIPGVKIPIIPKIDFGAFDRISERTQALMDITPTLQNLFTGGPEPTSTVSDKGDQTNIDQLNITIEGAGEDAAAIADQVLARLDEALNSGLDSANI